MEIRILNVSDAPHYQEIRLMALKINPEAFASTYEREVKFAADTVKDRLKPTSEKFTLGAFVNSKLVGMVTFMRENNPKMAHKGNIFGMFVAPEFRKQHIGKRLLLELISEAKACNGLEQINLTVVSDNTPAKKLYENLGFKVFGIEKNALKFNGQYFDEEWMVLTL